MTNKQIIIDGCEFQSDCIEYKDISYLKIMPICAIHELSIACHDKVNKCKYYKLYKQLKAKEQECEELKSCGTPSLIGLLSIENKKLKQTLAEIKEIADKDFRHTAWEEYAKQLKQILQKISEVNNDR